MMPMLVHVILQMDHFRNHLCLAAKTIKSYNCKLKLDNLHKDACIGMVPVEFELLRFNIIRMIVLTSCGIAFALFLSPNGS